MIQNNLEEKELNFQDKITSLIILLSPSLLLFVVSMVYFGLIRGFIFYFISSLLMFLSIICEVLATDSDLTLKSRKKMLFLWKLVLTINVSLFIFLFYVFYTM